MDSFRTYVEDLSFDSPYRSNMAGHPLVQGATVGIEIEFVIAAPPKSVPPHEWLTDILQGTDFEDIAKRELGYEVDDDLDAYDFERYIRSNDEEALAFYRKGLERGEIPGTDEKDWVLKMVEYWYRPIAKVIQEAGFSVRMDKQADSRVWAISDDGVDGMYQLPVIEIRTGIIPMTDLPKFQEALTGIGRLVEANKRDIFPQGNTGLHVHVHNANVGRGDGNGTFDAFSRLAVAAYTDEDKIWNDQLPHDRDFENFARLNKMQNYTTGAFAMNAHDDIIKRLVKMAPNGHAVLPNKDLWFTLYGRLDRNVGTNIQSHHPTVEYRYLTSALLLDAGGVNKVMGYIRYFVDNAASQANKGRVKFENDETMVVLTKMPRDMVRIDWKAKQGGDGREPKFRIPKPGLPRRELDQEPASGERPEMTPAAQWWKGMNDQQRTAAKQQFTKPVAGR